MRNRNEGLIRYIESESCSGIVGEVSYFLLPLKKVSVNGSKDLEDFMVLSKLLMEARPYWNKQRPENYIEGKRVEEVVQYLTDTFGEEAEEWKFDMAVFTFLALYLELKERRNFYRRNKVLSLKWTILYEQVKLLCPKQIFLTKTEFVKYISILYAELEKTFIVLDGSKVTKK